jgi:hypothetical protein
LDTLKLANALSHGLIQLAGELTFTLATQVPEVAVIVTFVPTGMPVMVLPDTVPAVVVKVEPALLVTDTLYVVPTQTALPALNVGITHPDGIHVTGEVTLATLVAHPFIDVAVMVTFVPTVIPVIVLPTIVPAEAVTIPLLLKFTL